MPVSLSTDLLASHALVNFVHAEYQGAFAFLNMLSQMGFRAFNPDDLSRTQKALAVTDKWSAAALNGACILNLNWTQPNTPECKHAFSMLVELKRLLAGHAVRVVKILQNSSLQTRSEELKFLIAALAHCAYAEDNYTHGMMKFAEKYQAIDIQAHYRTLEQSSSARLDTIHFLFELYMRPEEPAPIFFQSMREEALRLAAAFKTEIHEINYLLATFAPEFTYELAEIPADQSITWESHQIGAREAGYWIAYDFDAESAQAWRISGIMHAKEAWMWRQLGFDAGDASAWSEYGIAPAIAQEWKANQFSPAQAAERINAGQLRPNPDQLP